MPGRSNWPAARRRPPKHATAKNPQVLQVSCTVVEGLDLSAAAARSSRIRWCVAALLRCAEQTRGGELAPDKPSSADQRAPTKSQTIASAARAHSLLGATQKRASVRPRRSDSGVVGRFRECVRSRKQQRCSSKQQLTQQIAHQINDAKCAVLHWFVRSAAWLHVVMMTMTASRTLLSHAQAGSPASQPAPTCLPMRCRRLRGCARALPPPGRARALSSSSDGQPMHASLRRGALHCAE